MIAAIAVCVVVLAIVGALMWYGKALSNARVDAANKAGAINVLKIDLENTTKRADYQERRANALDSELDAVADSGDPATARERVLSRLSATEAAAGDRAAGTVPASGPDPAVARDDGDALQKPGD